MLYIDNDRWKGVPFVVSAGKGLDERRAEVRVQFRKPANNVFARPDSRGHGRGGTVYGGGGGGGGGHDDGSSPVDAWLAATAAPLHNNELVIRIQPDEARRKFAEHPIVQRKRRVAQLRPGISLSLSAPRFHDTRFLDRPCT